MKKPITYEQFKNLSERLDGEFLPSNENGFLRNFAFLDVNGTIVRLQYYKNICYAFIGSIQIPFTNVSINGTWPNRYKINLNLLDCNDEKVAIIPLKDYES